MARIAGLPFVTLFEVTDRVTDALPSLFQDFLERFAIVDLTSRTAPGAIIHSGRLQSLSASVGSDIDEIDLGFGRLTIPAVTGGLPVQLSMERAAIGGNLEPAADRWQLDLLIDDLSLTLDVLEGAQFQKEQGDVPRRLIRIRPAKEVKITGAATVRFEKTAAGQPVQVKLIDRPDPFDPRSVSGGVSRLNFTPPHFYFGTSEIGMTVTTLTFDFSEDYSPPIVLERNQPASWMGLVVSEATVYFPPAGAGGSNLSMGIRNFLLGSPLGLQGEVEVQFGRTGIDAAAFVFRQDGAATDALIGSETASGGPRTRTVPITAAQDESVGMTAGLGATAPPEGGVPEDWTAAWRWPDGSISEGDSARGTVRHGQVLRVTPIEAVAGQPRIEHPEVTFRFVAEGTAPFIDVIIGGTTRSNVTKIEGPAAEIAALTLTARSTAPGTSRFIWTVAATGAEHEGMTFQPALAGTAGDVAIRLREIPASGEDRIAHLLARADDSKPLLIGGEDGVVLGASPAVVLVPSEVIETFDLSEFHASAAMRAISEQATLDPADVAQVSVPDDGLAHLRFLVGGAAGTDEHDRNLRVFMTYDTDSVEGWQPAFASPTAAMRAEFRKPAQALGSGGEATVHRDLLAWAANYPGARFLVVGRCDDIGSDSYNDGLAAERAGKVVSLLTSAAAGSTDPALASTRIVSWVERQGIPGSVVLTPDETATYGLTDAEDNPERLVLSDPNHDQPTTWPTSRDTAHVAEQTRVLYRRVDVHAIGGTPAAGAVVRTIASATPPEDRRSLVPAAGRDPVPAEARSPQTPYRIKIVVGWDKPNAPWTELVPNLAEFEYAWSPDDPALPPLGGQPVDVSQEVLTIYGKWIHDELTGFTRIVLGIKSDGDPRGLFWNETPTLVAAAGFGPMLLSGVDFGTDTIGSAARVGALAGVMIASNIKFGDDADPLIAPGSEFAVIAVEAQAEARSLSDPGGAYKISLTADYTVKLHIDGGVLGFKTDPDNPVKIRYNKVGVEFDSSGADFWEQIGFVYKTDSLTIEDPGRWQISGVLGDLLRVVEVALGTGSFWIEARLAIALDIGVVEISEATFRLTFDGGGLPSFSLRGLVAKVNIPGTLEGEGRLRIEPDGTIKAGVDVKVIPLQMSASAAFAMKNETLPEPFTFVSLYVKVIFPVGIPLGTTGMAIHGFIGQTAINGERDITPSPDVVTRELGWWRKNPEDKYRAKKDQHALGLGVVLGTLPDASFSFSVTGMVVVAFPDPEVILGVEVAILSIPETTPTDAKTGTTAGITGLVIIDDEAVTIAVSASYSIPGLLSLTVPFGAYFPYSGVGTYVRIGSDGQAGRGGEPITITILPGTLDLQAWAYLMIEADGLPSLGGKPEFSFEGFSIGFGAGMGLNWSAGPIKLNASASILVGFGTDPLFVKGGLFVSGELDLVVVSVSARGDITLTYKPDDVFLDGEFCGEVDMWFFSLKGCVSFEIGNPLGEDVVQPDPPVVSVSLTDRLFRVMGEAAPLGTALAGAPIIRLEEQTDGTILNTGVAPKDNHTVWADTAPVLNFRHSVNVASTAGAQFDLEGQPSGEMWFGSNRLKYAYRLRGVRLIDTTTGLQVADPSGTRLQAAWMTSPTRQPDASGTGGPLPSGEEKQSLKLLDWDPFGWAVPMTGGGAGTAGDPGTTVGDLCEPLPQPARACVHGEDAVETGPHAVRMRQTPPATGAYPSRFFLSGVPGLRTAAAEVSGLAFVSTLAAAGMTTYAGSIAALPQTVSVGGKAVSRGYRLPAGRAAGAARQSLPWLGRLDRTVRRGRLTLMVCDSLPARDGETGGQKTCFDFASLKHGDYTRLTTDAFVLTGLSAAQPIVVTDRVELLPPAGAQSGSDSVPDIAVAAPGAELRLKQRCRSLEIAFFRPGRGAVRFEYTDAAGGTHKTEADGPASSLIVATLDAPADIVLVTITLRAKAIHIVRLCCVGDFKAAGACETFRDLSRGFDGKSEFEHAGFRFAALSPNRTLGVGDAVDESGGPVVPGQDGEMEIRFPSDGMRIVLPRPCRDLSLYIMLFSGIAEAKGIAADGNGVADGQTGAEQRVEQVIRLRSDVPMTEVHLQGGGSESWLYRICCNEKAPAAAACFDFARAPLREKTSAFRHEGATFFDLRDEAALHPRDEVKRKQDGTPTDGQDGIPEMGFAAHGFGISLSEPASRVVLRFRVPGDSPVIAEAKDGTGAVVAKGETLARKPGFHDIDLAATGIRSIAVVGGDGKAVLHEVCLRPDSMGGGDQLPDGTPGDGGLALPFVVTLDDAGRQQPWTPTILAREAEGGRRCLLVEYAQPAILRDVDRFQIVSGPNVEVTLVGFCAVDSRAEDRRAQDQTARDELRDTLIGVTLTPITEQRPILLVPGRRYRIEVDWSWQDWQSAGDGTDTPPGTPPSGEWTDVADPQVFEFLTALEDLAADDTGDGLNEYRFDPADLVRYLTLVDPADGRSFVFTDDPLWAHFSTRHLQDLLKAHGRKIGFDVRRTDPPPQPDDASRAEVKQPLTGIYDWFTAPFVLENAFVQNVTTAQLAAPCLPDLPVWGGASLAGTFPLVPNAMYDFSLIAPRINDSDPRTISATRFVTSRYTGPEAMLAALGFPTSGVSPFRAGDLLMPEGSALPVAPLGGPTVSDAALGAALAAIGADTLPLPGEVPRSTLIWQRGNGGVWSVAGLLLDAPEPLRRETAIQSGGSAIIGIRCAPDRLEIAGTGAVLLPAVTTLNWTRVLFTIAAPVAPPAAGGQLVLHLATSGGSLVGRRHLPALPAMIEDEGF
ncbi:hypothetical protein LHP98_10615 [Rhodobacter sp. Har01]|uniref:hypothetical protein n=1 Tax=Rhodobacter sp. Har01 TaxID=2883999 RepID=UPI001D08EBA2|nr:hypothetical protein [Rhodobacter sp. Har01]MCB6178583.1 hypothetical protein [Rhodobacter sp. Har01]